MKKIFKSVFGIAVFFLILTVIGISSLIKELDNSIDDVKENVGNEFVIADDTLMIMDYSLIEQNYTLQDGTKVSFELVKN